MDVAAKKQELDALRSELAAEIKKNDDISKLVAQLQTLENTLISEYDDVAVLINQAKMLLASKINETEQE